MRFTAGIQGTNRHKSSVTAANEFANTIALLSMEQ